MDRPQQAHETISVERDLPNCRDQVWSAWSLLAKKRRWFGAGLTEMDFSPGGIERSSFVNDMGTHTNETRYFEIKAKERIVFAYSMAVDGRVHTVSLATVAFADHGGGTRLTYTEQMCIIPPSDGAEGRRHGWLGLLGALQDYLADDQRPL